MKAAEIKVGRRYKAKTGYPLYGACVKVLEVGVWHATADCIRYDGVRVEICGIYSDVAIQKIGDRRLVTAGALREPWEM